MALDARPRALLPGALNSPKGLQDAGTYSSVRLRELIEQQESPRKEHTRLVAPLLILFTFQRQDVIGPTCELTSSGLRWV
ncbi:hypothetical protein H920_19795 [Fukomys damarensis]|uniref:Uncharacterized protein n=1 Tax=Fukomys damarensis TaxID=885580 RepID=A0A091D7S1_FUKDA|nr:hypothetical protein H920_19795 [Fukomys damarensis]